MRQQANGVFRRIRVKKSDSIKTIYAKVRRSFRAVDLLKYTELEEGIPAREVLAKLKATTPTSSRKRKRP
jgi:hypothetical protein